MTARVLSMLALRRGAEVPTAELFEALWGEEPPPTAHKSLQNQITKIRRVLGPDAVRTGLSGYALTETSDVALFEELVAAGRATEALAVWRGRPWQALDAHAEAELDALRLEELHRLAEEAAIRARLDEGDAGAAAEAERLVAEEPLREDRWALLVEALARSGRTGEALRAAQRARTAFADVGLHVGAAVAAAEARALDEPTSASVEVHVPELVQRARTAALIDIEGGELATAIRKLRMLPADAQTLRMLADALRRSGDSHDALVVALRASEASAATGEIDQAALALVEAVEGPWYAPPTEDALGPALERAVEAGTSRCVRARVHAALAIHGATQLATHEAHARAVRSLADGCDDAVATDIDRMLVLVSAPHQATDRAEASKRLLARATSSGSLRMRWLGLAGLQGALLELGDPAHNEVRSALRQVAAEAGEPALRTLCSIWTAGGPLLAGDLDAAEAECVDAAVGVGAMTGGPTMGALAFASYLFTLRWMQGRLAELVDSYRTQATAVAHLPAVRSALAMALAESGALGEARAVAAELFSDGLEGLPRNGLWDATLWHLTYAITRVGDRSLAVQLVEQLEPLSHQHAVYGPFHLGAWTHHLGRLHLTLGDDAEAAELLSASREAHDRLDARWWRDRDAELLASLT